MAVDASVFRILDASLNRATEGLRVVEDYARFALSDRHAAERAKQLRHRLATAAKAVAHADRFRSRDTPGDVGTTITTDSEVTRADPAAVAAASLERTKQALRSLEEYGKTLDPAFAAEVESLRYELYTLEKRLGIAAGARRRLEHARLYVLVDGGVSTEAFRESVFGLVEAGADLLQLRDKRLTDRQLAERAELLVELTRGAETLAIINDRADIAAAVKADGVHVGQDELPVAHARKIVGTGRLIGVSTHSIDQARRAADDGADYLGAGPTFPSRTKQFEQFPGLDYLREVAAEVALPTFAIGGISIENLDEVLATGIQRVAVASAVTAAADPPAAVKSLKARLSTADGPPPVA
ncbi:MAG: thiamine phosphate synthase [Planctomycetota bacterium]